MEKTHIFEAEEWGENAIPVPEEELTIPKKEQRQSGEISPDLAKSIMEKNEKGRFFGAE